MRQDNKMIRIVVNNQFFSYVDSATQALGCILEQNMQKLHYMSEDGIVKYMLEALLLVEETITEWGEKDISLKKRITQLRKGIDAVKDRDRGTLMNFYVNMMLGCQNMAALSGFGMCTTKTSQGRMKTAGKIYTNPEKKTTRGV